MPPSVRSLPQVCFLFLAATLVSVGVIYFLNAEIDAKKRHNGVQRIQQMDNTNNMWDDGIKVKAEPLTLTSPNLLHNISSTIRFSFSKFLSNFKTGVSKLISSIESSGSSRKKRSFQEELDPIPNTVVRHHRLRHHNVHGVDESKRIKELENDERQQPILIEKKECYHSGDVLIVVAITCLLNFSFVLLLWASVRWVNGKKRKKNWKHWKNKQKRSKSRNQRYWEMSESSESEDEDSSYSDDFSDQDNQKIVKSYSMEDLRFYG